MPDDPGGVNMRAKQGEYPLWFGQLWAKGLTIGTGQTPVRIYNKFLRDMIISGRAKPSFIVTQRMPLDEARVAYEEFDKHAEGFTKVIFKPEMAAV
jgi:glutathione-independent formaldehyde dehydrogenase